MAIIGVPLTLGKAEHRLRYDFWAWGLLEDRGWPIPKLLEALQNGGPSYKLITLLCWAGVQHETPAPALEEVGHWLDAENQTAAIAAVGDALAAAFPAAAPAKAQDGARPLGSTGQRSGATVRSPA